MAKWFIEAKDREEWRSLSRALAESVTDAGAENFGWSEGDPAALPNGRLLLCFDIPDRYGSKVELFERWAKTTGRIYGVARGTAIAFPHDPDLAVALPPTASVPIPPWLR